MSDPFVLDVSDLAPGETRAVDAFGAKLLVCNAEGRFYAIQNRCPHAMVRLDTAVLRGCILECPVHGGRLDVRDGSPQGHPIRRPATTYPVRQEGGRIEIELGAQRARRTPCTTS
jgi:nitrite reductase/ring-hydroxylating ferredoxin subunit